MKVEMILQSKGADVYSVRDDDTVSDAVSVLNGRNVGALIVKNAEGEVSGIISERDIVRRLGRDGPGVLAQRVSACMTANPYTCDPEQTIDEVMQEMTSKRIRHMPVVSGGSLIGVISIGDVVKRKIELTEQEADALKQYIAS